MIITDVTVVAHEKRNHPHEYGHRDAEVRLTAKIEDGDDVEDVLTALRIRARLHVNQELLWWIMEINAEVARQTRRREFRDAILDVKYCGDRDKLSDRVTKAREQFDSFNGLFEAEIEDWYAQLEEAEQFARARMAGEGKADELPF